MKKLLKILGFILLGLLILVILAVAAMSLYFTDERLRARVLPEIQEYTGRDVQIERISYSFFRTFPRFGLIIEGLEVPDPVEEQLASMDRLQISLSLLPLLRGEVSVQRLQVDRPVFTYIVYEDGHTNLDDFLPQEEPEEPPESEEPSKPMDLHLARVEINDAHLGMIDHVKGTSVLLTDLDLVTSLRWSDVIKSSVEITLGALDLTVEGEPMVSGLGLSLSQTSVLNLTEETLELQEGQLNIEGLALSLAGRVAEWGSGQPVVDLRIESHSDDFGVLLDLVPESMEAFIAKLETGGALDLSATLQGRVGGEALPAFDARVTIADGFIHHNAVPERISGITLSVQANNERVVIESLEARAGEASLSASGELREPLEETAQFTFSGSVNADLSTADRFVPLAELGISTLAGLVEVGANAQGQLSAPDQAAVDVSLQLTDGRIGLVGVNRPVEQIAVNVRATNEVIDITNISARSLENVVTASGSVNGYLGDAASFAVSVDSHLALNEINEYYPVQEKMGLVMSGVVDTDVQLSGAVANLAATRLDGTVRLAEVNVEYPALPQPLRDLNGTLVFAGDSISAEEFAFFLGESDMFFAGTLRQYQGLMAAAGEAEPARFSGRFHSSSLDVDSLLKLGGEPEAPEESREPVEAALPNLAGDFNVAIDRLTLSGIEATDFHCDLEMSPRHVSANQAQMAVFGGSMGGRFRWDIHAPDRTGLTFHGNVDRVRLQELFSHFDLTGQSQLPQHLQADFSSTVDLTSDLDEYLSMVKPTLRMNGRFNMGQGVIAGHPIQNGIADAIRLDSIRNVPLSSWLATFRVEDGVLHLNDVNLTSQDMALELGGSQNLASNELDYRADVVLPRQVAERLGGVLPAEGVQALVRQDGRVGIPVTIRGTSGSPRVGVDDSGIRERVESYLRGEVDARRQQAEQEVREAAEQVRQQAEQVRQQAEQQASEAADQARDEVEDQVQDAAQDAADAVRDRLPW
ncbi:MAG: AsmA family protein [Bradymonadales bacterium]|nr:AsmA family protein [Bradymonadales bacterium]